MKEYYWELFQTIKRIPSKRPVFHGSLVGRFFLGGIGISCWFVVVMVNSKKYILVLRSFMQVVLEWVKRVPIWSTRDLQMNSIKQKNNKKGNKTMI